MKPREELWKYWQNPLVENQPIAYAYGQRQHQRSKYLVELCERIKIKSEHRILEVGCNVGRNLSFLWEAGYKNLTGIEINKNALAMIPYAFPNLKAELLCGKIEDVLPDLGQNYHLVFSMAVLVHIHPDSEAIFGDMVNATRKWLITIEDEQTNKGDRHIARNYKDIFGGLGMELIFEKQVVPGLSKAYRARVFSK